MKKYAVILDDDKIFANILCKKVENLFNEFRLDFDIDVFNDIDDMRKSKKIYQLAFMDIILSDNNGIDIVSEWTKAGRLGEVIFVSAYEHEVFNTFECQPIYFVRKTHLDEDLERAVMYYKDRRKISQVIVPEGSKFHVWDADEIVYLMSKNHYIDVYKSNGEKLLIRGNMSEMERIFESYNFVRVQVSYLVNLKYVVVLGSKYIQLSSGERLRISTKYFKGLYGKLGLYFTGEVEKP